MANTRHMKQLKRLDKIAEDLQKEGTIKNIEFLKALADLAGRIERKEFD